MNSGKNPKLTAAVLAAGGVTKVAERLGESPQVIANWVARGRVPVAKCAAAETALEGRVTKSDLRPTDWRNIWPEAKRARAAA